MFGREDIDESIAKTPQDLPKEGSEFAQLEKEIQLLKSACLEIDDLSQDIKNLLVSGSTVKSEEATNSMERKRGEDRILESQLRVFDCINILNKSKRLLNLVKGKFE